MRQLQTSRVGATETTASGQVSLHPKRFGFVNLDTPIETDNHEPVTDIFIPPPLTAAIVAGDYVTVTATSDDTGRYAATRVEVTGRTRQLISGVLSRSARGVWFCDPEPTVATKGLLVPARLVPAGSQPGHGIVVAVDPAEHGRPEVISVVAGPFKLQSPAWAQAAAVAEGLGAADYRIGPAEAARAFATTTLRGRSSNLAAPRPLPDPAGLKRRDRRAKTTFTVDSPQTCDIDDALSAERRRNGNIAVEVHIADAARLIPAGSAADQAAYAQGTSVYLQGRTMPMLAQAISEAEGSLLAGQDRYSLTVAFDVTPAGEIVNSDLYASIICSDARLSYRQVQDAYYQPGAKPLAGPVGAAVSAAVEAARRLGTTRDLRASLDLGFVEADWQVSTASGRLQVEPVSEYPQAMALIERLMVAANETVGAWLEAHGVPALFRVHEGPEDSAWEHLTAIFDQASGELGEAFAARDYHAVLAAAGEHRPAAAAAVAAAMTRACYLPWSGHHFGLDSRPYLHFTSPLRRYADLVVHRIIRALLAGEPSPYSEDDLTAIAAWIDSRSSAAARTERAEERRLWAAAASLNLLPPHEPARISRISKVGAAVRFDHLGTPARVAAADLPGIWVYDGIGVAAAYGGRPLRIGDLVEVDIADIDLRGGHLSVNLAA